MRRNVAFVLPPEAVELVEQVRGLEAQARRVTTQLQSDLAGIRKAASDERNVVAKERAELARDREALETLLASRVRGFAFIGDAWGDYERARADAAGASLQYKKHPARSAAKEVRAKGKELAALRRELKRAQWVLALYEFHFPWLSELRDLEEELAYVRKDEDTNDAPSVSPVDPAQRWLSTEEYEALSPAERNQRALDR